MKQIPLPKRPPASTPTAPALSLTGPSRRLRETLAAHEKLLAKVARRRAELDQLTETIRATMTQVASRMAPLAEEATRLDEEVHQVFTALLGEKRSKRARKQLRRLYLDAQQAGVISWRFEEDDDDADADDGEGWDHGVGGVDDDFDPFGGPFDWGGAGASAEPQRVESAPRQQDRGVLRDLYRRLVEALHPDMVQDEADKGRRTEIMKDVTRAYRDGDFARLVEIERSWAAAPERSDSEEDLERRHGVLLDSNRQLTEQLRMLERELRELRRSPGGQLAGDVNRKGGRRSPAPIQTMVDNATEELEQLRELHRLLGGFKGGQLTLAQLVERATPEYVDPFDDFFDMEQALDELMRAAAADAAAASAPKRWGGQGGRKPSSARSRRR